MEDERILALFLVRDEQAIAEACAEAAELAREYFFENLKKSVRKTGAGLFRIVEAENRRQTDDRREASCV